MTDKTLFAVELTPNQQRAVRGTPLYPEVYIFHDIIQQLKDQLPEPLTPGWYEVTLDGDVGREVRYWSGNQWQYGPTSTKSGSDRMYKDPRPLVYAD